MQVIDGNKCVETASHQCGVATMADTTVWSYNWTVHLAGTDAQNG